MTTNLKNLTIPILGPDNELYYQCWTGVGTNPGNYPRCPFLGDPDDDWGGGIGDGVGGITSDQYKLQGRQTWETEIKLVGSKKPLEPAAVKEIYIEEDVFNYFTRGYIVVDAWHEGMEREAQEPVDGVEYWHFRNDSRDEFEMKINPKTMLNVESVDLPPEVWSWEHKYVIYDKEDMGQGYDEKVKKLYFWDKNYQLMMERKIQWSTTTGTRFFTPEPKEPVAHATDLERSMPTGEAIASLLWDAGFDEYIDFDNWDIGGANIYYTTKAGETVLDALKYIYSKHVSKDFFDNCLLTRNRYTRKYQLIPFYKIFEFAGDDPSKPGPWQREHLFFEETAEGQYNISDFVDSYQDETIISPWKAPLLNGVSYEIDIKSNQWGFIQSYYFTDMAGVDSSIAMVSKPVHTHWNKKNQFIMNFKDHEVEKTREDFIIPYRVDMVLGRFPLYTLNRTKTDQIAIDHRYSLDSTLDPEQDVVTRLSKGRNETIFSTLFLNEVMAMQMYGSTHREAGMFIGIDRYGWSDNDFDWKMLGQWYVTSVVHNFKHEKYVNKLTMVKLHAYDEFKKAPDEGII